MSGPLSPFTDVQMLRLDIDGGAPPTYYVTPFVGDGAHLYVFDEPGDRSDALETMLLGRSIDVSARATGELRVTTVGRRATPDEERWARDACSARFFYDQALQDLAQLGALVVLEPSG